MTDHATNASDWPAAGLLRRLSALVYDGFLLAALWFVTAGAFVLIYPHTGLPMAEVNGLTTPAQPWLRGLLFPLLIFETWFFYAWFWLHGGQTLGMRAWRLEVRALHGRPVTVVHTLQRFLAAILSWLLLGAGWLLALVPPYQTLHDRLSGTETVVRPKVNKKV
jgi:uncharacterized RDD family membrane protein YckC